MLNLVDWKVYAVVKSAKHALKNKKKNTKKANDLHYDELLTALNKNLDNIIAHLQERSEQKSRVKNRKRHAEIEVVVKVAN